MELVRGRTLSALIRGGRLDLTYSAWDVEPFARAVVSERGKRFEKNLLRSRPPGVDCARWKPPGRLLSPTLDHRWSPELPALGCCNDFSSRPYSVFVSAFGVAASRQPQVSRKGGVGVNANGSFKGQPAPCGKIVDVEHWEDHDDDVVVTREAEFACGCVTIQHEYHDGSVSRRVVRHDGHVLVDELLSAE